MKDTIFKTGVTLSAAVFLVIFCSQVLPPFMAQPDLIEAFAAGFVNPFSTGYSVDVICCWFILVFWVIYEHHLVKYGWVAVVLGIIPGVAVGLALYLLLRLKYLPRDSVEPVQKL